ncbi:MAG TPA: DUF262 domain-containing protein [Steroidobacteraceae bacterium]|nr:DUF262 domain-containing protein [Steroidobacteraceae bacterium]
METQVRTPQGVFNQPQRLMVPLFQRPYVWSLESQWQPLWTDVTRIAERLLKRPGDKQQPHFLGAVVLQQVQKPTGHLQERIIIDGQQRLTTLQLLMDALHGALKASGSVVNALRLEALVENPEAYCKAPEDRFKVWPTNRDRPAFNAVMSAAIPIDYDKLGHATERMVLAHRYFYKQASEWLAAEGPEQIEARSAAIESCVRDSLQLVVIDLAVDENAQEIFETLNARGAQLTAADLVKNFVFQRLSESKQDVETLYAKYWKDLETPFWETEIQVGRLKFPRSSIFLNHWLVSQTGQEVLTREVFHRFKRFADDSGVPMATLLERMHRAAAVYRSFLESTDAPGSRISRLGLFGYRTGVLESEVVRPLVLTLLDPELPPVPPDQLAKALEATESWMVRRMLVRATTKNYNMIVAEVIRLLAGDARAQAGDVIEHFLASQTSDSSYWPDDEEIQQELGALQVYRRIRRARLRMLLETLEDCARGWVDGKTGLGGERVARGSLAIEHVLPRKWQAHWPLAGSTPDERDRLLHTLGNLTLLTKRLNSSVSNGPWLGEGGKRAGLEGHDVFLLNRSIIKSHAVDQWSETSIKNRTTDLIGDIIRIWKVPPGHKSGFAHERVETQKPVEVVDLIAAGVLEVGTTLHPRRASLRNRTATVMPDGGIGVEDKVFPSLSAAAIHLVGKSINGWSFFLLDLQSKKSMRDLRTEYLNSQQASEGEAEDDDEEDED